jgi:hypothetical protein
VPELLYPDPVPSGPDSVLRARQGLAFAALVRTGAGIGSLLRSESFSLIFAELASLLPFCLSLSVVCELLHGEGGCVLELSDQKAQCFLVLIALRC